MADPKTPPPAFTPQLQEPEPVHTPAQPAPPTLAEPTAGGNYLRDPITGALSVNPAFASTTEPQE